MAAVAILRMNDFEALAFSPHSDERPSTILPVHPQRQGNLHGVLGMLSFLGAESGAKAKGLTKTLALRQGAGTQAISKHVGSFPFRLHDFLKSNAKIRRYFYSHWLAKNCNFINIFRKFCFHFAK